MLGSARKRSSCDVHPVYFEVFSQFNQVRGWGSTTPCHHPSYQTRRHSTLGLVGTMCVSCFSFSLCALRLSLAGHKCLIRCLAVHIKEEETAGCLLKGLSPATAREREWGKERDLDEWLEVHAPRTHRHSCTISASKGVKNQKTLSAPSTQPSSCSCKWILFALPETLLIFVWECAFTRRNRLKNSDFEKKKLNLWRHASVHGGPTFISSVLIFPECRR